MGSLSIWHWLIVLAVVLLLFGGSGKVSTLMGDFAKGVKSFKKNMADDESMEAHGRDAQAGPVTRGGERTASLSSPVAPMPPSAVSGASAEPPLQEPVRHG